MQRYSTAGPTSLLITLNKCQLHLLHLTLHDANGGMDFLKLRECTQYLLVPYKTET